MKDENKRKKQIINKKKCNFIKDSKPRKRFWDVFLNKY